jgi:plastocyanin
MALAGAVSAGCGGAAEERPSGAGGGGGADPAAAPPPAPGAVAMNDIQFIPARSRVKVGEKVTWRNEDPLDHNVVARSGARFKSRAFGQGGTYNFTPKEAGTIRYVCTLHPGMDGVLEVVE